MTDLWPKPEAARIDLGEEPEFDLGGMRVKPAERAVEHNGKRSELQPRVMRVLVALAKARPAVVSRDRLVESCWEGRIVGDDALNRCILALRHVAQQFSPEPFAIQTVPRIGYRLVEGGAVQGVSAQPREKRRWRIFGAVAVVLLVLFGAVMFLWRSDLWPWPAARRAPTVLVTTAGTDRASQEFAGDLAVKLGSLQPVQSASVRLISQADASSAKPDLILQVSPGTDNASVGASVALIAARDRTVLWSKELQQPSRRLPDLKQQIAVTAAYVLRCASEGLASEEPLNDANFKLYLTACGGMADAVDDPRRIVRMLERVVQSSPRFVDGWAKLLFAEVTVLTGSQVQGEALIPSLKRHMAVARKLEPHLAEAYLAEFLLIPESDFVGRGRLLDKAVEHNPQHAELRVLRSYFLQSVGRIHDALVDATEAVKLDPLSPSVREAHVVTLGMAGRVDTARQELHAMEQLWPDSGSVENARLLFNLRWGDPREALRTHSSENSPRQTAKVLEPFLRARIDPTPANIEEALRHGRMVFRERPSSIQLYSQLMAEFDRNDELFEVLIHWRRMDIVTTVTDVMFRPAFADFHREPRFMQVADHLGLVRYWRKTGEWPDFCYAADLPYDCKGEAAKIAG
jgi:DNA-binding winged helix-turn-helix (wHTH) protein